MSLQVSSARDDDYAYTDGLSAYFLGDQDRAQLLFLGMALHPHRLTMPRCHRVMRLYLMTLITES